MDTLVIKFAEEKNVVKVIGADLSVESNTLELTIAECILSSAIRRESVTEKSAVLCQTYFFNDTQCPHYPTS